MDGQKIIKFAAIQLLLEAQNYSGTIQSSSIIQCMTTLPLIHSSFALKGFLNAGTAVLSKRRAPTKVIAIDNFFLVQERLTMFPIMKGMEKESLTFHPYEQLVLAHQNNGHKAFQNRF
jgi:monoamine oxidase